MGRVVIDADRLFLKVRSAGCRYVHKGLGITVYQGEPAALHLYHDTMSFLKGMRYFVEVESYLGHLSGHQWLGLLETVAEFTTDDLGPYQALITCRVLWGGDALFFAG